MAHRLYLSLMPEALVASQLSPEEFGAYYAVGSEGKTQGQAAFFELDPSFRHPFFPIEASLPRCVAHPDGKPKRSVYLSVYRVVEHVPLGAILRLYLVTKDGRTLGLDKAPKVPADEGGLHLYHEIAPLHPLVVSSLGPVAFHDFLMRRGSNLGLPALCWTELKLGALATDPERGDVRDLPYENLDHLRSCLAQLKDKAVTTKMVDRIHAASLAYRTVKNGVFYGTSEGLAMFPLPGTEALKEMNYPWWRSANM